MSKQGDINMRIGESIKYLQTDLKKQINDHLEGHQATKQDRACNNIMNYILQGEDNCDTLEAKWLHTAWSQVLHKK
jgi:hypothetical protein